MLFEYVYRPNWGCFFLFALKIVPALSVECNAYNDDIHAIPIEVWRNEGIANFYSSCSSHTAQEPSSDISENAYNECSFRGNFLFE
jgi:hypothetical protein